MDREVGEGGGEMCVLSTDEISNTTQVRPHCGYEPNTSKALMRL